MSNNNINRLKRVQIAQDTLRIVEQGDYQNEQGNTVNIKDLVDSCVKQTRLFTPEELEGLTPELPVYDTQIEVVNETSLVGAKRLHDQQTFKRIGVLILLQLKMRAAVSSVVVRLRKKAWRVALRYTPVYRNARSIMSTTANKTKACCIRIT